MSVAVSGFKSGHIFEQIRNAFEGMDEQNKKSIMKKGNGVFLFEIKNAASGIQEWVIDLKKKGTVTIGKGDIKPDIQITVSDDDFEKLAYGKLNGQKAFTQGKLKVKGQMMLAMKLDGIFKSVNLKEAASDPSTKVSPAGPTKNTGVKVPGYLSSEVFSQIKAGLESQSETNRKALVNSAKAIFQFNIKKGGNVQQWTLDLKNGLGSLSVGASHSKADIVLNLADEDFVALSQGKANGQKLFMSGKLKVQGQMMLATKLDGIFKKMSPQGKL